MTAEDVEQQIRRHPTANERFLLGLLDEARTAGICGDALEFSGSWIGRVEHCTLRAGHAGWHEIVGDAGPTRWSPKRES